jgi:Peptidase family M23
MCSGSVGVSGRRLCSPQVVLTLIVVETSPLRSLRPLKPPSLAGILRYQSHLRKWWSQGGRPSIPDNNPASDTKAVPINLETVGGNYLILDLRNGFFAFYAHLKPGSLRVNTGDKVHRGQVIASLGNSGNSDAPHLHYHVSDDNSPLGAGGVPYVLDSFVQQGILSSKSQLVSGGWQGDPRSAMKVQREMPVENAVITLP